jgi:hypothetical protein
MVSYSKYSDVKKLKAQYIKNKLAKKKTKVKIQNTYIKNENKKNNKNTKKRKHTKKGNKNNKTKKSKKNTPKNINQQTLFKGGFFGMGCGVPSVDKIKSEHDKLNKKLLKFIVPLEDNLNVLKENYLKEMKQYHFMELIQKREKFNNEQLELEATEQVTKQPYINNINKCDRNIDELNSILEQKRGKVKKEFESFNKKKKKYDKESTTYNKFLDKITYGKGASTKKGQKKTVHKGSFAYKMNTIIDIKKNAEITTGENKDKKKYNKCKSKYDKAILIHKEIKELSGKNMSKIDKINIEIVFIEDFIKKDKKKHDSNLSKFTTNWVKNTTAFYKDLILLVPEPKISDINGTIKGPDSLNFIQDVKAIQSLIVRINDILSQADNIPIIINMLRELKHVLDFIEGVKKTQEGIIKDLKTLKVDFLNRVSAAFLKSQISKILTAHLQNTRLLLSIHFYFDNIDKTKAIKLFTETDTYLETDTTKRQVLAEQTGYDPPSQNVYAQKSNPLTLPYMKGGAINFETLLNTNDNPLIQSKMFSEFKTYIDYHINEEKFKKKYEYKDGNGDITFKSGSNVTHRNFATFKNAIININCCRCLLLLAKIYFVLIHHNTKGDYYSDKNKVFIMINNNKIIKDFKNMMIETRLISRSDLNTFDNNIKDNIYKYFTFKNDYYKFNNNSITPLNKFFRQGNISINIEIYSEPFHSSSIDKFKSYSKNNNELVKYLNNDIYKIDIFTQYYNIISVHINSYVFNEQEISFIKDTKKIIIEDYAFSTLENDMITLLTQYQKLLTYNVDIDSYWNAIFK